MADVAVAATEMNGLCWEADTLQEELGMTRFGPRKRRKHCKSTTGCQTCRHRHIKCDERRPGCVNCQRTGRSCPGYASPPSRSLQANRSIFRNILLSQPSGFLALEPLSTSDLLAYDFFRSHTVPVFQTFCPGLLADQALSRLLISDDIVMRIAIVVGSAHRKQATLLPSQALQSVAEYEHSYARAIRGMRCAFDGTKPDMQVITVACLLFIMLESLQGNTDRLLVHLSNGIRVVSDPRFSQRASWQNYILQIFLSIGLEALLYRPSVDFRGLIRQMKVDTIDLSYSSPLDALRTRVDLFLLEIFDFNTRFWVDRTIEEGLVQKDYSRLLTECTELEKEIAIQHEPEDKKLVDTETLLAILYMEAACTVAKIYLQGGIAGYQTAYDKYCKAFASTISLVERCLQLLETMGPVSGVGSSLFSIRVNLIHLLHATAITCRHAKLRRRAIELMHQCPPQGGPWNSVEAIKVATMVVDLEEQSRLTDYDGDTEAPGFIAEQDRVHLALRVPPSEENKYKAQICMHWKRSGWAGGAFTREYMVY